MPCSVTVVSVETRLVARSAGTTLPRLQPEWAARLYLLVRGLGGAGRQLRPSLTVHQYSSSSPDTRLNPIQRPSSPPTCSAL